MLAPGDSHLRIVFCILSLVLCALVHGSSRSVSPSSYSPSPLYCSSCLNLLSLIHHGIGCPLWASVYPMNQVRLRLICGYWLVHRQIFHSHVESLGWSNFQIERGNCSVLSVTHCCVYFYVPTSFTIHCYVMRETTLHFSLLFAVWLTCSTTWPRLIRSPERAARSQSLYRLRYPAHNGIDVVSHKTMFL